MKKYSFGHFVLDVFLSVITGGIWLGLIVGYWIVKLIRKKIEEKFIINKTFEKSDLISKN